jgi:hypothetical protein
MKAHSTPRRGPYFTVHLRVLWTRSKLKCGTDKFGRSGEADFENAIEIRANSSVAGAVDDARHDQYRAALDSCRHNRCRTRSSFFRPGTTCRRFGCLLCHYSFYHQVVAAYLTQEDQHRLRSRRSMKQKITDFEKDDEDHWRAILACGHRQHVRHDPPMTTRRWVLTEEGRASRIGFELDCKRCDEEANE